MIMRINFDLGRIVRKNIRDATVYTRKIYNFVVKSIMFYGAKQC